VEELAVRCRSLIETSPEEALKLVHQLLHEDPGNERLLTLQSTIVGHMSERSQEQARSQYLQRAHEALSKGKYLEALRLLESCKKEGISSPEIAELMDFARQEADRGQKNTQIQNLLRQAQSLMARGAYADVVDLLGAVQQEPATASLIFILDDARSRLQSFQTNVDSTLQAVESLGKHEQYAEAVRFLEAQPASLQQIDAIKKALASMREANANEMAALRALGGAYAGLEGGGRGPSVLPENTRSSLLGRIVPIFASRRKSVADRQVSTAIDRARAAIDSGDKKQAASILEAVTAFVEYASGDIPSEWQSLSKKVGKGKGFGKVRT
jgi:hypothetical protein